MVRSTSLLLKHSVKIRCAFCFMLHLYIRRENFVDIETMESDCLIVLPIDTHFIEFFEINSIILLTYRNICGILISSKQTSHSKDEGAI